MKILFVNAVPNRGGAAKAARRIAAAVQAQGHEVCYLTIQQGLIPLDSLDGEPGVAAKLDLTFRKIAERLPAFVARRSIQNVQFSCPPFRSDASDAINRASADVVNLHWVNYGQVSPEGLAAIRAPVVWTLHDMWPFTGGCHHSLDCERYTESCGACPILSSQNTEDLSYRLWQRKRDAWRRRAINVVTPSHWLAECARRSSLFSAMPTRVIPNPVDLRTFSPGDKCEARQKLGLPPDVPIVLFAAQKALENAAKGYSYLKAAMRDLQADSRTVHLAVLGSGKQGTSVRDPFPIHFLGYKTNEAEIVSAYRSADVFVLPSICENLPNTIGEALACGIPCVAFSVGGIPDMIVPNENGYLARPFDVPDLRRALEDCLAASANSVDFGMMARRRAETMFDAAKIGKAYVEEFISAVDRQSCAHDKTREKRTFKYLS
jgi:glycosyltransferase involved in cell wall biosynthesis